MKLNGQKGFTLVELMVVIVIIGILAAVAIPKMTSMSGKAKASEVPMVIGQFERLHESYFIETGSEGTGAQIGWVAPTSKFATYDGSVAGRVFGDLASPEDFGGGECKAGTGYADSGWRSDFNGTSWERNGTDACTAMTPNFKTASSGGGSSASGS